MPDLRFALGQVIIGPLNFALVAACLHQTLAATAQVEYVQVAAVYVIKTPPLRRAAGRAMKYLLVSALPRLVWRETKHAWQLSSRRSGIAD